MRVYVDIGVGESVPNFYFPVKRNWSSHSYRCYHITIALLMLSIFILKNVYNSIGSDLFQCVEAYRIKRRE